MIGYVDKSVWRVWTCPFTQLSARRKLDARGAIIERPTFNYEESVEAAKQDIQAIRHETGSAHSPEAQERAKLLRMELVLQHASMAQAAIRFLQDNPRSERDEVFDYLERSCPQVSYRVRTDFVASLDATREQVLEAMWVIDGIASGSTQAGPDIGAKVIYDSLRHENGDAPLEGEVRLSLRHPLAPILYVDDPKDFDNIDPRNNVGGFYNPDVSLYYKGRTVVSPDDPDDYVVSSVRFPCIAVKGFEKIYYTDDPEEQRHAEYSMQREVEVTTKHEEGHAENAVVQDMNASERKLVWGRYSSQRGLSNAFADIAVDYVDEQGEVERLRRLPSWRYIMGDALSRAKDEILAEMVSGATSISPHVDYMLDKGGLYDYFGHSFLDEKGRAIGGRKAIYDALWNEYTDIVRAAEKRVLRLKEVYRLRYGLQQRQEFMRWVLAQWSLEQWPRQVEGTLFYQEVDELETIINDYFSMHTKVESGELTPADAERRHAAFQRLYEQMQENQDKPYIGYIKEFYASIQPSEPAQL